MVINHNISIKLGIVNGAMGTLHSMVLDPKHFNKDQEQIKNKWREINDTAPGQVHWLDQPPLHVNVQIKKAVPGAAAACHPPPSPPILSIANSTVR